MTYSDIVTAASYRRNDSVGAGCQRDISGGNGGGPNRVQGDASVHLVKPSGTANSLTLSIGDGGSTTRFINAAQILDAHASDVTHGFSTTGYVYITWRIR